MLIHAYCTSAPDVKAPQAKTLSLPVRHTLRPTAVFHPRWEGRTFIFWQKLTKVLSSYIHMPYITAKCFSSHVLGWREDILMLSSKLGRLYLEYYPKCCLRRLYHSEGCFPIWDNFDWQHCIETSMGKQFVFLTQYQDSYIMHNDY